MAVWNLVCTVDAFLSSGFTPAELMRWVHPALVANTQGTGMGGMSSMQSLYINTLLGENNPNDILQEALPNVIAAHVVQSYVGSYGAMIHPVAACATTAVSVEEGVDKIRLGKAEFVVVRWLRRPQHRGHHRLRRHVGHRRHRGDARQGHRRAPGQPGQRPPTWRVRGVPGRRHAAARPR